MRAGLTKHAEQCLRHIIVYQVLHGCPPSYDELMEGLGLRSKNGVHRLITQLEERGHVIRRPYRRRTIEVVTSPGDSYAALSRGARLLWEALHQDNQLRDDQRAQELLDQVLAESVGFTARQDGFARWHLYRVADTTRPVSGPHKSRKAAFEDIPKVVAMEGIKL